MKTEFLKTKKIRNNFTKRCLGDETSPYYGIIKGYWTQAKNIEEFVSLVLSDKRLEENRGYWELAKEKAYYYDNMVNSYLGARADDHFTTYSDVASLKVGNEGFTINIPNQYGDGENNVYIFDNMVELSCVDFLTTIEGTFNIYGYDCGKEVAITLHGKYAIYRASQVFVFVKWENI